MSGTSDRKRHWESIYGRYRADELSWYQASPETSLDLIAHADLSPSSPIIDIGGGDSVLVDCLLDLGFRDLTVLDLSSKAIERSHRRLGDRAERIRWLIGDVTGFALQRRYSLWHDRAVLHFLTRAEDRRRYVEALNRALVASGQAVISTFSLSGPRKCSGLQVRRYSAETLAREVAPDLELCESFEHEHVTPRGIGQSFLHCRFKRAAGCTLP